MEGYEGISDEELILRLRDGDGRVMDFILEKYKGLVRSKAKSMYLLGADGEDLIQEGMIGLFKAVRDYDPGRDASFYTFADLCVSRQMYTAVQASSRKKHMPLNRSVSLNAEGMDKDGEGEIRLAVPDARERSPEDMVIDRENLEQLESVIEKELSPLEKQVLDLYLTGMGYAQIARVLGRDGKSTDNALQRIRGKLRKAFRKEE
ncbi:MAG TPA: RNA polymerase sporulation sigma factor SigH [Candidatus Eisenbergiella merdigallinarum]|uniref:RNA polymerase sporulation sigma factor SigH n=1 Tax=Candidatus Eisenbergiella merdigallinarum TaxID=2838552 RepID=A0A9D2MPY0_9FIRM|nr:RNA polymerase sporulation sigma factor SigH [Candidatus Eisenbergiella merdigallinarum]